MKANLFNVFSLLNVHLSLPSSKDFITDKRLTTIKFNEDDILKMIRNLNVNEAHDHDDISMRMLKICDSVVTEPLLILLKTVQIVEYFLTFGKCLILYQLIKK